MVVYCKIIKTSDDFTGKFTVYYLSLFKRDKDKDLLINKQPLKKRYSDFLNFKENLESRFKCNIPYFFPLKNDTNEYKSKNDNQNTWFNPVTLIKNKKSTDASVVTFRKTKLEQFLNDLLSDSFDDKWKKSIITSNFLEIDKSYIVDQNNVTDILNADSKLADAYYTLDSNENKTVNEKEEDWWVIFRNLSDLLKTISEKNEQEEDKETNLKTLMKSRLLLQRLESNLYNTDKHRDLMKRESNFKKLKQELYDKSNKLSSNTLTNQSNTEESENNSTNLNNFLNRATLMSSNSSTSISSLRATPGRTLGCKKQMLEEQKTELKSQEQQLADLHSTVVMQKNLGIAINNELKSQMELMDSVDEDLTDTSRKINRANNKANKYNNNS